MYTQWDFSQGFEIMKYVEKWIERNGIIEWGDTAWERPSLHVLFWTYVQNICTYVNVGISVGIM